MKSYPWLKNYPEGVPHEIEMDKYRSVVHLFEESCKKYGDRVAFDNMGATLTYAEVDKLTRDFAAYLQNGIGLKKGDRIAIQMPNALQFPVAFFGALRAGLIVVNTNPLYTPREMEHQFKDSGAVAIVIVANFAANLQKIVAKTSIRHIIVTQLGDMLGGLKGPIVNFVVKNIKKMVPPYELPGALSFKDVLKKGSVLPLQAPEISNDDVAVLQYTGGTTGVSKGAKLSHGNLVNHNTMVTHWFYPYLNSDSK